MKIYNFTVIHIHIHSIVFKFICNGRKLFLVTRFQVLWIIWCLLWIPIPILSNIQPNRTVTSLLTVLYWKTKLLFFNYNFSLIWILKKCTFCIFCFYYYGNLNVRYLFEFLKVPMFDIWLSTCQTNNNPHSQGTTLQPGRDLSPVQTSL